MNIMKLMNKNKLRCGIICLLLCMVSVSVSGQEIIMDYDFGSLSNDGYDARPYTMPVTPSQNIAHAHFSIPKNKRVHIITYPVSDLSGIVKIHEADGAKREVYVQLGKHALLEGTSYLMAGNYDVTILCTYTGSNTDK